MTAVRVALLHPLLTVACGDDANVLALAHRATRRGLDVESVAVHGDDAIPTADIYLLGGSGQAGVRPLAEKLAASEVFTDQVAAGAVVLAVDAGLDALGRGIVDERGQILAAGLGLLGFTSARGPFQNDVVVTQPVPDLGLPAMGGWVQHRVSLRVDPGVEPFVELEVGHSDRGSFDGVRSAQAGQHVIGTRLHGPVLGRNPELADVLLAWATAREVLDWEPLPPGPQEVARDLRVDEDRATASRLQPGFRKRLLRG